MASRTTLWKAQKLQRELEAEYPNRKFAIEDKSAVRRIGKIAALTSGYEIIEDGDITVLANCTRFSVLEIRHCRCGEEIYTQAIGEDGLNECAACKMYRENAMRRESANLEESNRRAVQEHAARDEWEQ